MNLTTSIEWHLKADFDVSGTFETDITAYVNKQASGQFQAARGINGQGVYTVSQFKLGLDNHSGVFTLNNTASALYGKIRPHVPIQITCVVDGVTYTLWTGYMRAWDFEYGGLLRRGIITVDCLDLASYLAEFTPVNLAISTTRTSSSTLIAIFAAMGLVGADYDVATGVQSFPYHWARNQTALAAAMDAVRSEMGGLLWVTGGGKLRSESRHTRLGTSVSGTWGDGTSVTPKSGRLKLTTNDVITTATVRTNVFATGQAQQEVWRLSQSMFTRSGADSMLIAPGETFTATFNYGAGILPGSLVTPLAGVDYGGNTAIDGSGTDKTSAVVPIVTDLGAAFNISITNTDAAGVYVTFCRLRGQEVQWVADRPTFVVTKSVPWIKVGKGINADVPWASDYNLGRDYAYHLARTYRYPYPVIQLTFDVHRNLATAAAMLSAELGQRIRFKDVARGVANGAMLVDEILYIEGLAHSFAVGAMGSAVITLSPSYNYRNLDSIAYDMFQRANATGALGMSLQGQAWATSSGWDISSNAARANSASPAPATLSLGTSQTDHVVEVNLTAIPGGATSDEGGVVFRYQDASNYYKAYVSKATSQLRVDKVVAGTTTNLYAVAWTPATTGEIRAMVQGTRIRVWLDFVLLIDGTDASLSTGVIVGLWSKNASGTVKFTDFYGEGL